MFGKKYYKELRKYNAEILFSAIFRDSIQDIDWIKSRSFSASGGAANYSFLYILFRVLNDFKPKSIIEFGMGETSKLTSQYVSYGNSGSSLILVENDQTWIDLVKGKMPHNERIHFLKLEIENIQYKSKATSVYKDFKKHVYDKTFDLIILDGPAGADRFSRIHILELIPENIAESFVIIVDDTNRKGEKETVEEVLAKLKSHNMNCDYAKYGGITEQHIIYSPNLYFLRTL